MEPIKPEQGEVDDLSPNISEDEEVECVKEDEETEEEKCQ